MGKTKTLTEGTPWKQILLFSIPIFWGNIFQLLYSLVDTKIVGSTLGTEALAAVGSVSTLHTLMTGFLNGLTLGFSLITAMCFGADNMKRLKKSFAMTIELGVLTTAVLVVVLMFVLQPLLHLLNVPEEQFAMSYAYISVLIVGLFATVLYNLCANTLRAIGDSLTPLLFLILATVSNIGLDYLFILEFHMGVQGAAYATVLAQLISVVLCCSNFPEIPDFTFAKIRFSTGERTDCGNVQKWFIYGINVLPGKHRNDHAAVCHQHLWYDSDRGTYRGAKSI